MQSQKNTVPTDNSFNNKRPVKKIFKQHSVDKHVYTDEENEDSDKYDGILHIMCIMANHLQLILIGMSMAPLLSRA